jgi:hypothetical protein
MDVIEDLGDGSCPPQRGQSVMSISNTRFKRWAQVSGAVGVSLLLMGGSTGPLCRVAGAAVGPLCFRRCRRHAVVGTMAWRMGELGAKTS